MKQIQLILMVLALAVSGAALRADTDAKADLTGLQGQWSMVRGVADGELLPDYMVRMGKRICKDDVITVTIGAQLIMKATITIDATKKPKTIDFDITEGPNKGKKQLGIYELEGDTLKSCFAAPDAARPADFDSKPGDLRTSTVWKRDKKQSE